MLVPPGGGGAEAIGWIARVVSVGDGGVTVSLPGVAVVRGDADGIGVGASTTIDPEPNVAAIIAPVGSESVDPARLSGDVPGASAVNETCTNGTGELALTPCAPKNWRGVQISWPVPAMLSISPPQAT